MQKRMAVIGAGSWGTTIADLAARNTPTVLWCRRSDLADEITKLRTNSSYLRGFHLHPALCATHDLEEAVGSADAVVMCVPSEFFRSVLETAAPFVRSGVPIISLTKGLEQGTKLRMTQVVLDCLPEHPVGVLTGPNLSKEILGGNAAAAVVAMSDELLATELQRCFATSWFRVYVNQDVVGSELAGVMKNVIAIASGIAEGLGAGDNTRAAMMTRGVSEMTRLGVALGGDKATFAGLAGMGDLIATCISPQSRNRSVGEQLADGRAIATILAEMDQVAEGVKSAKPVLELAEEQGVEVPITREVVAVIHEGRSAAEAYQRLLQREAKHELYGYPR